MGRYVGLTHNRHIKAGSVSSNILRTTEYESATGITTDSDNNVTEITLGESKYEEVTYNNVGLITSYIENIDGNSITYNLLYDAAGIVTSIQEYVPPVPTYTIAGIPTSISEGSTGIVTVQVTGLNPSSILYWDITNPGDFTTSSGNFSLDSNLQGTISIGPLADQLTEGPETFVVRVRTGSTAGAIVTTSDPITINDTSNTPTFTLTPPSSIDEGSAGLITCTTTDIFDGTTLYWDVIPTTDFTASDGSVTINSNSADIYVTPDADQTTEGPETFQLKLYTDSARTVNVATSSTITINDSSQTPAYAFSNVPSAMNEGETNNLTVTTTNTPGGTTLYWDIAGGSGVNSSDFAVYQGSITVNNNTSVVQITTMNDLSSEGPETFQVRLFTDSGRTNQVAITNSITINDTSTATSADKGGSVSFDGVDDHLNITGRSELAFGTGNFTLECWVYFTGSDPTLDCIMETRSNTSLSDGFLIGRFHTSGHENKIEFYTDGSYRITADVTTPNNTWVHVAVVRQSGTTRLYLDGQVQSSTYSDSNNYSNDDLIIGENANNVYQIPGLISNFRMVKGTAVYTSNFTVPTSPLTAIPNTKLLCCQSTISPTVAAIDFNGLGLYNISGTAGSYAPSGFTGGIDFPSGQGTANNSNGSYILNADTSFSGNYTIEFWFNIDSFGNYHYGTYGCVLLDGRPNSGSANNIFGSIYAANSNGGTNPFNLRYHANGSDWISGNISLNMGTWHHCALVRNGGTITLYVNGTADGTYSHSVTMTSNTNRPYVGGWGYIAGVNDFALNGKMSNLRIGSTAVYTSNFTPPTSNLTALSGTTFLGLQSTSSTSAFTSSSGVLSASGGPSASSSNPF